MSVEAFNKSLDIGLKLSAPVGVVIMLYLQTQFVTRPEFQRASERADARLTKIEEVLIRMEASAEVDRRHDSQLVDHEGRIRALEKGIAR
jgi:hypothetical protein